VTFARAQSPYCAGETRVVPDDVAERLGAEGAISAAVPWGAPEAPAPCKPARPIIQPRRPQGGRDQRVVR
jgi:hypothetical protein